MTGQTMRHLELYCKACCYRSPFSWFLRAAVWREGDKVTGIYFHVRPIVWTQQRTTHQSNHIPVTSWLAT